MTEREEVTHRPAARSGMGDHVEICFPERGEKIILSEEYARELAEEMIEIVEEENDD